MHIKPYFRERQRGRETEREREKETDRQRDREQYIVYNSGLLSTFKHTKEIKTSLFTFIFTLI